MNREGRVSDMSRFRGQISPSETLEILRRNAKTLEDQKIRLQERDAAQNLIRFGGYGSRQQQSLAGRRQREISWQEGGRIAASFGISEGKYYGKSGYRTMRDIMANAGFERSSAISSAGLSFKNVGYFDMGSRWTSQQNHAALAEYRKSVAYNNNQLAKANQINLLEGGYELGQYIGSALSLPSLQEQVALQDQKMKSIGLDRTEAFQIIDTLGRGREEIDDRILWKDRLNNISKGTAVL